MIQESVLIREAGKVAAYIEKYVTVAGAENRQEVLELFDKMYLLFPHWVITTCPMMHPDIHYVTKNGPSVFGYSNETLIKNSGMEKFFFHVHNDDQEDLYQCFSNMHNFLETIPPEDHHKYRAVYHYRFRKADGLIMYLHDEKAAVKLRGSGNLYYTLFRDITNEKTFSGVMAEIFKQEETLIKIREFKPSSHRNGLSKREKELVILIKQGLSTKEIAYQLNISHHTVRNIKSNLFEKYKVSNSIELLNATA